MTIDLTTPLPTLLDQVRRAAILHALEAHEGNRVRAAEALGIARSQLYSLMHRLGLA